MRIRTADGLVLTLLKPNQIIKEGDFCSALSNDLDKGWIEILDYPSVGQHVRDSEFCKIMRFARPIPYLCGLPEAK